MYHIRSLKVTASKALLKPKLEFTSAGFCDTLKLRTFTAMPSKLHLTQTIKCTTYFITVKYYWQRNNCVLRRSYPPEVCGINLMQDAQATVHLVWQIKHAKFNRRTHRSSLHVWNVKQLASVGATKGKCINLRIHQLYPSKRQ